MQNPATVTTATGAATIGDVGAPHRRHTTLAHRRLDGRVARLGRDHGDLGGVSLQGYGPAIEAAAGKLAALGVKTVAGALGVEIRGHAAAVALLLAYLLFGGVIVPPPAIN